MSWPAPNQAPWNHAGIAMPDMSSSFTPEQWAMMQQQNWQQWSQWQQQYSQWHNHYGDEYAQLHAIQNLGGAPPPPPSGAVPPPPDKPPPPPPHENNQPLFNIKDKPAPNPPQQRNNANYNTDSGTGNKQSSYSADTQQPQPAVNSEDLKKLAEEERLFDIQFQKWEEEIDKWRTENVNHPDKQAYKDYEAKFEACRKQLLERRQHMNTKRANLLSNPALANTTGNTLVATPIPKDSNKNSYSQKLQTQNSSSTQNNPYERQYIQAQNLQPQNNTQNNQHERPYDSHNRNNKNIEPLGRFESYNKNAAEDKKTSYPSHGEHAPKSSQSDNAFLQSSSAGKGIPGLDLVPDTANKKQEIIDLSDENAEKILPDYSTISLGINNILGDEKIMNILSMVQGIKPQGAESNNASQGNRAQNFNQPQPYAQNMPNKQGQFQHQEMNSQYQHPNQGGNYNRPDPMQQEQYYDQNNQFGGPNRGGFGGQGGPRGPRPGGHVRPGMQQGGPNMRQGGTGMHQVRPGMNQGGPGMNQGGPGMNQGGPGMSQGGPGMSQGGPGMSQGGPGMNQGGPGMSQGGPGMNQSGQGLRPNGPGMRPIRPIGPGMQQGQLPNMQQGGPNMQQGGPNMQHGGRNMQQGGQSMQQGGQSMQQGGPNMQQVGPNMQHGGRNMQQGGLNMQQGGRNMQQGGLNMQQGGPNMQQGGPNMQQGGRNIQQGGPNMQHGGPNMQQGGPNMQQGAPSMQQPKPLMAQRISMPNTPMQQNTGPARPPLQEVSSQQNYAAPQTAVQTPQPPKHKWVEDPLFTPSIVVEYEHKSLRLKARDFIEPVHTFDYNHISKEDEYKKKDFEHEAEELFARKPRRSERDFAEDRFRDQGNRDLYSRDYDRKGMRDDFRDMPRDIREIRGESREIRDFRDLREPRDAREPRIMREREPREFSDLRDFRERDIGGRDDRNSRDRMRDGPREDIDIHRVERYGEKKREDLDSHREDRYVERKRDDLDRHGNKRVVHEDMRERDRRGRRDGSREGRRDDYRDSRRDENRDGRKNDRVRSHSRDKDSRKRGISQESDLSNNSKKSKDAKGASMQNPLVMIDDLLEPPGRDMRPAKIVVILRGIPGSGKSYLAKLIRDREAEHGGTARIMSIDDYFMQEGEIEETDPTTGKTVKKPSLKYEYDASSEEIYTSSLKRAFKRSITDGYFSFLIYDAPNISLQNYADIWNFSRQNGFQVYICSMEQDLKACFKRQIHNRKIEDLEVMLSRFFTTPAHHIQLDATTLLQSAAIEDVQMEDVEDVVMDETEAQDEVESVFTSKWEKMDDANKLARLDGISKPLRPSSISMEEFLQLDDWTPNKAKPGKKSVRWADLEERREQEKMRAIGFVVGQTDWNRMTDPTMGSSALTQTKYIERVKR